MVEISGLDSASAKDLNGMRGKIIAVPEAGGRCKVRCKMKNRFIPTVVSLERASLEKVEA